MTILLKGIVRKWEGLVKGWSKRYFILKEDCIEYYPSHKKLRKGKKFDLKTTDIIDCTRDLVIQMSTSKGIITIKFCTDKEKAVWLRGLENAIELTRLGPDARKKIEIASKQDADLETVKRRNDLDSFKELAIDKAQELRNTVDQVKSLKGINAKKAPGFIELILKLHTQINEIERVCLNNVDSMVSTIDAVHDHIRQNSEDMSMGDDSLMNDSSESYERNPSMHQEALEPMANNKTGGKSVKQSMQMDRPKLDDSPDQEKNGKRFNYIPDDVSDVAPVKLIKGSKPEHESTSVSIVPVSPTKAGAPTDYEEEKIGEDDGELSEEDDIAFYDAVDYMIYDELEKSVYEVNKRRPTVMIQDHKRSTLPALKPKASINIFKILKDSIGKDLSKF